MKKKRLLELVTLTCAVFVISGSAVKVDARESTEQKYVTDKSLGGMSLIMNEYYKERLSETGISIQNVTTPVYVDGNRINAVNTTPLLSSDIGVSNAIGYVNIRKSASMQSEVVGKLYSASIATILSNNGEWAEISSGNVNGFVRSEFLSTGVKAQEIVDEHYQKYAIPTTTTLNIRSGPGTDYSILDQVPMGEQLEVVSEGFEWIQVNYKNNKAYVSKDYVDTGYEFSYAISKEEEERIAELNAYNINNMIWPLPADHTIYTYYGYRTPPTKGASSYHKGLDIGGPYGANVVTVLSGTVITTSYNSTAGNYVEINHGNGVVTRYLHNSKILVYPGQKVKQGDTIALVGSTGASTGAHLHFSLLVNGNNVDPYPYLKAVH